MPEITRHSIRTWIETVATGEFHYRNILGLSGKLSPEDDTKLRKIIYELCHEKEPICESIGRNDGYYRPVQNHATPLLFEGNKRKESFPIELPFNLRKYVFIYPDNTIVVAGSKSSGKTGFLYNVVKLNLGKTNLIMLSNMEGGQDQMYDRFFDMGIDLSTVPGFIFPVYDNFHDYIKERNTIYVIDYIDAPEGTDFYLIGAAVSRVNKKLQGLNSVAVIGLQKPTSRDTAFGGEQTLKVATLYVAMDYQKLKIVDAKVAANPKIHPKNMQWSFVYNETGTEFLNIQESYSDL